MNTYAQILKDDIQKLISPHKQLTNQKNILYILPTISTETIGGTLQEVELRKFLAIQLLKELKIRNIISDIETIFNSPYDNPVSTREDIKNWDIKLSTALSAYIGSQIQNKTIDIKKIESKKLYNELKKIIESDPVYQKYCACVSYKYINNVYVPIIIGTKTFQVHEYALMIIMLVAAILDIPLNSIRSISRLERIFKSNTLNTIFNFFEKNRYNLTTQKIKEFQQKLLMKTSNKNKKTRAIIASILNLFTNPDDKKLEFNIDIYKKFTTDDLFNTLTQLKIAFNAFYFANNLNNIYSEYIIKIYVEPAKKDLERDIKRVYDILSRTLQSIDNNDIIKTFDYDKESIGDLNSVLNTILNEENIIRILSDEIIELDELYDRLKDSDFKEYCDPDRLKSTINSLKYSLRILKNSLDRVMTELNSDLESYLTTANEAPDVIHNIKASMKFKSYANKLKSYFKKDYDDTISAIQSKQYKIPSSDDILDYDTDHTDLQQTIKKILSEEVKINSNNLKKFLVKSISSIIQNSFFDKVLFEAIESYITRKIDEILFKYNQHLKYFNDYSLDVVTDLKETLKQYIHDEIQNISKKIFLWYRDFIIRYITCRFLNAFFRALDIDKYDLNGNKIKPDNEILTATLIVRSELIDQLTSAINAFRPDIMAKIDYFDIEPKKIPNPLSSNLKYNTQFIVNKLKIMSILVYDKEKNSVIFKLPFMKKPEKTSFENIRKFNELYRLIVE